MANNIWSRTGSFRDACICYVIIPYICLLCKSNKTIGMFYGLFTDEGNNPVENQDVYNVEGDNRLSPDLQF